MEKITLTDGPYRAEIWSRGACVNDLRAPDRQGRVGPVLLGYASEADRLAGEGYLGEICGPFANRIAAGGYVIDGQTHTPDLNDEGRATLHGGSLGWSTQLWQVVDADQGQVHLRLDWSDPTGGFPGPIQADVIYRLAEGGLTHQVRATTMAPTVLNVVSHPYFNLSAEGGTIDDHELTVPASAFLPIDQASIPLPEAPQPVDSTPFDFRRPRLVGQAVASSDPQVSSRGGVDHALIVDGSGRRLAARLRHEASGRQLDILTDYPALQVYTGQFLDRVPVSHPAGAGSARSGIALETEEYPDAPRRPDFPSCLVRPGEVYTRTTTWQFSTF